MSHFAALLAQLPILVMIYAEAMSEQSVTVHLFAAARAAVGESQISAAPGRLADIIESISAAHPEFAAVAPRCSFLVDEQAVHGTPADITVPAGARLDVLPPFAGG